MASGGLHTEALSYARFLQAVTARRGLATSTFDQMLNAQTPVPVDSPQAVEDGVTAWGLGFAIQETAGGVLLRHGGANNGFRSGFVLDPSAGLGYVVFTNSDQGDEVINRLNELLFAFNQGTARRVANRLLGGGVISVGLGTRGYETTTPRQTQRFLRRTRNRTAASRPNATV